MIIIIYMYIYIYIYYFFSSFWWLFFLSNSIRPLSAHLVLDVTLDVPARYVFMQPGADAEVVVRQAESWHWPSWQHSGHGVYVAGAGSGVIGLNPYPNQQVHSLDAVGVLLHFQPTHSSKRTERYFHAQGLTGLSPGLASAKELKRGPYRARCGSIHCWDVTWHGRLSCTSIKGLQVTAHCTMAR